MSCHEVVPSSPKICDWQLNSSWNHFNFYIKERIRVTMKLEVFKRPIFMLTLSITMIQWLCDEKGKWGFLVAGFGGPWTRNVFFFFFFLRRKKGGNGGEGQTWKKFQNCPFGHIHTLSWNTSTFWVHGYSAWSMFYLHLVRGPKTFRIAFSKIWLWKCDHGKTSSSMG
jgi:hypothetical protein